MDRPERLGAAWSEALAADRQVLLECLSDPNVPPLPPHITAKQARNFMRMTASEPELGGVLMNTARQMIARVLPGHHGRS